MQRLVFVLLIAGLIPCSGCTVYDWAFGLFRENYNGGGPTSADQRYHFDHELEKWKEHQTQTANDQANAPKVFSK